MMFTRSINTYDVSASTIKAGPDGKPTIELIGTTTVTAPSMTKSDARRALIDAGYTVPRGAYVDYVEVGRQLYGMPIEVFMEHATPIESE